MPDRHTGRKTNGQAVKSKSIYAVSPWYLKEETHLKLLIVFK